MTSPYNRLARHYDLLGALYSAGSIARSKREHLRAVTPGKTILYAGAGTGEECALAAALGARVTVCDESAQMLAAAKRRFQTGGLSAEFRLGDALALAGCFDFVVAPYFLNTFASEHVGPAVTALASQVKSGGQLIVTDFRAPTGWLPFRILQRIYYLLPQLLFLLLTRNPWHELYDYARLARSARPDLLLRERVATRVLGLPLLETIYFERVELK